MDPETLIRSLLMRISRSEALSTGTAASVVSRR
jgi:hypothetical protein